MNFNIGLTMASKSCSNTYAATCISRIVINVYRGKGCESEHPQVCDKHRRGLTNHCNAGVWMLFPCPTQQEELKGTNTSYGW